MHLVLVPGVFTLALGVVIRFQNPEISADCQPLQRLYRTPSQDLCTALLRGTFMFPWLDPSLVQEATKA